MSPPLESDQPGNISLKMFIDIPAYCGLRCCRKMSTRTSTSPYVAPYKASSLSNAILAALSSPSTHCTKIIIERLFFHTSILNYSLTHGFAPFIISGLRDNDISLIWVKFQAFFNTFIKHVPVISLISHRYK